MGINLGGSKTICSVCASGGRNPTTSGVENEPKDSLNQTDSVTNGNAHGARGKS